MRCFIPIRALSWLGLLFIVAIATAIVMARPPATPDEGDSGRLVDKLLSDRQALSKKLITAADDVKRPEAERWQAVVALARLGNRDALEYLVEHITLQLQPPDGITSEDLGEDRVCYYALTHLAIGWERDGRNWNVAQIVLRALTKPRTKDELCRYARVLELSVGVTRLSYGMYSPSPRAVALIDAEIASEAEATQVHEFSDKVRPTLVVNLKAIRKLLTEKGNEGQAK